MLNNTLVKMSVAVITRCWNAENRFSARVATTTEVFFNQFEILNCMRKSFIPAIAGLALMSAAYANAAALDWSVQSNYTVGNFAPFPGNKL